MLLCGVAVARESSGQDVLNKYITLEVENTELSKVLSLIERQTEVRFLYSPNVVRVDRKVSVRANNKRLESVLADLFEPFSIAFSVSDNRILLKSARSRTGLAPAQIEEESARPTDRTLSGTVTDEAGATLPGVSILIKNTQRGTTTDQNGKYSLTLQDQDATLVFSYVGYEPREVSVLGLSRLDVSLKPDTKALGELVVIGYGVQNRRDVTGAVSTVKAADLNHTNAVSIDNMLQGKAAGLNVTASTAQPGGALNINIRGAISPNGDNSPLYVIDGFPISTNSSTEYNSSTGSFRGGFQRSPLNSLNPNDIESIDILKDAGATAIYGSAAANGVILITTKKGREGRAVVNYSGTYSFQTPKHFLQPLNASEFRTNVNLYGQEDFKFVNRLAPYGNGTRPLTDYKPFFTDKQVAEAGQGTDYVDYVLRQGMINDQNISVSTGNATTKLFTSFNFFDQKALLRNSNFTRYAGRINIDQKIGSRVNFSLGLNYSQINNDNVPTGQSDDVDSPSLLQTALQFAPDIPAFGANGKPSQSYYARTPNPASYFMITNQTFSKRLLATPSLQISVAEGVKINLTGGIDNTSTDRQFFIPVSAGFSTVSQGNAQRGLVKLNNYSSEAFVTFDRTFGDHRVSAVAGVGYYSSSLNDFGLSAVGFGTDAFGIDNIGIASNRAQSSVYSNHTARTKLSQFSRLNYTLRDKYIVQLTGRFDGTNGFPKDNLFGFFPGISAGWILSEESFLKSKPWVSQLKLRAGYGTSGNESITINGNYGLSLYSLSSSYNYLIGNQFFNSGFAQGQLGNPELRWETNSTINVGVDYGFFNNRISGSIEYFNRTARDLLDFRVLPSSNAITRQAFNVGSTRSRGFEFTLRSENLSSGDFSWSTLLTLGTFKSFWVERNPAVALASFIGKNDPIRAVYGWKTDGLIRSVDDIPGYQKGAFVGNVKYVDKNGDGKLDINDVSYLGNNDPKATFGFDNTFKYKGLDLSVYVYGSFGNLTNDQYQQFASIFRLTRVGAPTNVEKVTLDSYTSFDTDATYPGRANDPAAANNPSGTNDFRRISTSYFARLKDITLGYSLPTSLLGQRKFVRSVRVFANINNLGYLTNIRGLDPETERNNNPYPTARTTAFGLNVQF